MAPEVDRPVTVDVAAVGSKQAVEYSSAAPGEHTSVSTVVFGKDVENETSNTAD